LANLVPKVPAESWLEAARQMLVQEGIDAVKVDRLAKGLGVSRGGFYYHFADRDDLLIRLLGVWKSEVVFVPSQLEPSNPHEALQAIEALVDHLLGEDGYDPRFDLAVRSWAHSDTRTASAVQVADVQRIATLTAIFRGLRCEESEAAVRARVFYFHQIGYYLIDLHEDRKSRREHVSTYISILCGEHHLAAARSWNPGRTQASMR
jgi:AcrR family transcriptional regulator